MNAKDDRNDLKLGATTDVNLYLRTNVTDDRNLVANRVNRNCVRRDLTMDANLIVKNLHVKSMVYLNTSCDRMSHDHLQYDRQMMRHHDTNRMDEMNLDEKMKIHHVSWC
jgi:hypothetical protein